MHPDAQEGVTRLDGDVAEVACAHAGACEDVSALLAQLLRYKGVEAECMRRGMQACPT